MKIYAGLLATLIGIAGWYYLFYSQSARRLAIVENPVANNRRHRFRQLNGVVMLLLASLFYAGFFAIDPDQAPRAFVVVWLAVFVLLFAVITLAVVDLRLTRNLRRKR